MIRPVCVETDAAAITAIYNPYIQDTVISFETEPLTVWQMAERISSIYPLYPYLVYEEDGQVMGYCYAHPWKERRAYRFTLETTIYLHPQAKSKGVGRMLMEALISECREAGFHSLLACITAENTDSVNFHLGLGFEQVSRFMQVGFKRGRWLDVVDLQLML